MTLLAVSVVLLLALPIDTSAVPSQNSPFHMKHAILIAPSKVVNEVCRHEAGHYVIGRCLGFKVDSISVEILDYAGAHNGESAVTLPEGTSSLDAVVQYAERRVQMLYAGAIAQAMKGSGIDDAEAVKIIEGPNAATDFAKARELLHIIRNIKYPEDTTDAQCQKHLTAINRGLWLQTMQLGTQEADVINGLGSRLASDVKVIRKKYTLQTDYINSLPAIIARYGKPTSVPI